MKARVWIGVGLLVGSLLGFAALGRAGTISVSSGQSIQAAVNAAGDGDTIMVMAGMYTEQVTLTPGKNLTIVGEGRDVVTWIAPAEGYCLLGIMSGYIGAMAYEISGFTFNCRAEAGSTYGAGVAIYRAANGPLNLSIHDNRFVEDRRSGDSGHWATSIFACHNRYASRDAAGNAPVLIYNNLDETWGGMTMSNSQAYDVFDNTFDGCSDAIYCGHGCPDSTGNFFGDHHIYGNTFRSASDSLHPGWRTPAIDWQYYGAGLGTHLPSIIENNYFEDNDTAMRFVMDTDMAYPENIIRHNSFLGNPSAIVATGTHASIIDASGNWWGTSDPGEVAAMVDATNVDFCPILKSGADEDGNPANGWQPDLSAVVVHTLGQQVGAHGRITEGIGLVSIKGDVDVVAGTYNEAVLLDRCVNLRGPNAMVNPVGAGAGRGTEAKIIQPLVVNGAAGSVISGFLFEGIDGDAIHIEPCGVGQADRLVFRNNIFRNNTGAAIDVHAPTVSGWFIDSNLIDGNTGTDESGMWLSNLQHSVISGNEICHTQYAGIILQYSEYVTIIGNYIHDIPKKGIQVAHSSTGPILVGLNTISNTVISDVADEGGVTIYPNVTEMLAWLNVLSGNHCGFTVREKDGAVSDGVHVNWNAIVGNEAFGVANFARAGGDLDATLNWWGTSDGPTHASNPGGDGDAVTDDVIFSPWLGIDPDGDPATVGVQLISPMLFVVDNVGPEPQAVTIDLASALGQPTAGTLSLPMGYLNRAISAANFVDGHDTIEVRPGTYGVDEEITDGVSILSTEGACETTLTGEIEIGTAGVLLGEIRSGFRIDGNVRVMPGQDASLSALHWNDIYGTVENAGDGTFDATYNFWGAGGPVTQTIGSVDVYPDLPLSSCTIIGYINDYGMTVAEALAFGGLMADGYSEGFAKTVMEIVTRCGISNEQALALIFEYNHGRVKSALRRTRTCEEFYELLEGYAMPAGAGGAAPESVVVGEPLNVALVIVDPLTGDAVTDALVTVTVCREDVEPVEIAYFGVLPYDAETGMYGDAIDTTGWEPGTYRIYMGTDRMSWSEDVVEVTAP